MSDNSGPLHAELIHDRNHIGKDRGKGVVGDLGGFVGLTKPAEVWSDASEPGLGHGPDLMTPKLQRIRKSMKEEDRTTFTGIGHSEPQPVGLDELVCGGHPERSLTGEKKKPPAERPGVSR